MFKDEEKTVVRKEWGNLKINIVLSTHSFSTFNKMSLEGSWHVVETPTVTSPAIGMSFHSVCDLYSDKRKI